MKNLIRYSLFLVSLLLPAIVCAQETRKHLSIGRSKSALRKIQLRALALASRLDMLGETELWC
ncbi:MAG TPA: hypothetical protein VJM50_06555, partial [Pyrinomonadaceae bacterium]|nr:hypothetical protein [Pyrinomonadaceae bacterium]